MPTLRAGTPNGGAGHGACSGDSKDEYIVPMVTDMHGNGDGKTVPTLTGHHAGSVSDFSPMIFTAGNLARGEVPRPSQEVVSTLQAQAGDQHPCVASAGDAVRRMTPRECERLQGFPDDYTLIPGGNRTDDEDYAETVEYLIASGWPVADAMALADTPDGPRYKALGNSMAVPVMRWIGERIAAVDAILK